MSARPRAVGSAAQAFTIHILVAVAEHERDAISARTKAALVAAKANGKKLGNYRRIAEAKERATVARRAAAVAGTAHLLDARCCRGAEPSRRPDRKRRAMTRVQIRGVCQPSVYADRAWGVFCGAWSFLRRARTRIDSTPLSPA